jgi:hypothetical protein
MPQIRTSAWLVVPVLLLVVFYWPGLTSWFYQDDFGWLNLRHDVHSGRDLAVALLAPKAHGNMRPLGENAYWLGLSAIFGVEPLPFHICTFLTQAASLLPLGSIVWRMVAWQPAGLCAQILWLINPGLAPATGWSSIYNQVLSGFFFLLAFYFLLRHLETGRRAHEVAHWAAFVLGLGALEINVVYPALAALYVVFHARPYLKRILPMFAVSAAAVAAHFYFAPPAHVGVYAPHVGSAVAATLWTYWGWALGATPLSAAASVILLIVWGLRRGESTALPGAAWFLLPFRAMSIPGVYLASVGEPIFPAAYVLPQAIARRALSANRAVVYRFDGQMLHNVTAHAGAQWTETEPRFVNIGDPMFADYVGAGWREAADGRRRMEGVGTVRIAPPRNPGESLYIGVFETRDFRLRVRVNGIEVPVALVSRDMDISLFRATLPPETVRWTRMEVTLESGMPLRFSYAEVR